MKISMPNRIAIPAEMKTLLKIAAPCVVEQYLIVLVGMVSVAIVGQIGRNELTASSMTNQLVNWIQCLYTGLAAGATVVIARMWGSKDTEGVKKSFMQALVLTILVCLSLLAVTIVFQEQIVNMVFGAAQQDVLDAAHIYFSYCMLGMPATGIMTIVNASVRGTGDNKTPMYSTILLNAVNIALSIVLIYGVPALNIPAQGIVGAGVAVTIARYVAAAFVVIFVIAKKAPIIPEKFSLRFNNEILQRILKVGLPSAIEQVIFQGGFVILQTMLIGFGTVFQGGYQIGSNINGLNLAPGMAIGVATTTMISQALGRKDYKYAKQIVRITNILVLTVFSILTVVLFFFVPVMCRMYSSDAEVLESATYFAQMFSLSIIPVAYFQSISGVLRGAGDVRYVAVMSIIGLWVMRLFLVWVVANFTGNGYIAVTVGVWADFMWRAVTYFIRVRKGNWLYIRV